MTAVGSMYRKLFHRTNYELQFPSMLITNKNKKTKTGASAGDDRVKDAQILLEVTKMLSRISEGWCDRVEFKE